MTTRRLSVIMAADTVGFSAMMEREEEVTLARVMALRRDVVEPKLSEHKGRLVKTTGDGFIAEFASANEAVRCGIAIQAACEARAGPEPSEAIKLRIGINLGDIIGEKDGDIHGEGVNIAARLEALCEPSGMLISGKVYDEVAGKLDAAFESLGEQQVKNLTRPVRVYAWSRGSSPHSTVMANAARPALTLPDKPSLAVLPFQNMSGDAEQEYFADGMVEEITAALSRVKSFFIIARNTSFTYKGKAVDVKQVGRELGVRYVLEGSVRKAAGRVRITAQLIDATTGNHIWSDRYDDSIEDIFDLQDRITESVVGAIQPSILFAEIERTKRKRPESLDAYDYVLRALPHVWAFDAIANRLAMDHLNRAIDIEPEYPLALSLLAWCQARQVPYQWTPLPAEAKAGGLRLTKLAGEMNNDDPLVLTMLCAAHSVVGDLDIASALIEKALALDPNSAMAWQRSGWVNAYLIRPDVSIAHFQRAIRLSPFDPMNFNCIFGIGTAHFVAERYEEALPWLRKGILERPAMATILRVMAACLGQLERIAEAREVARQYDQAYPGVTISKIMANIMFRDAAFVQRYSEGLRKAGLPE